MGIQISIKPKKALITIKELKYDNLDQVNGGAAEDYFYAESVQYAVEQISEAISEADYGPSEVSSDGCVGEASRY